MNNRRVFFTKLSSLTAGVFAGKGILSAQKNGTQQPGMGQMDMQGMNMQKPSSGPSANVRAVTPGNRSGTSPVAVTTLDVGDLPFTVDNGVKVFNLIAEPVKQLI